MRKQKKHGHMPRVAIVYTYLPLYHLATMRAMLSSSLIRYELFSGTNTGSIKIKVVNSSDEQKKYNIIFKELKQYWIFRNVLWQRGVISIACNSHYDAVIFAGNAYYISTWIAAFIGRIRGQKIFMRTHGVLRQETGLKGLVRKMFYRLANGIMLYENRAKDILKSKSFAQKELFVTYNSLDYNMQKKVRDRLSREDASKLKASLFSEPDHPLLIFVGRLTPHKRLDLLIKAVGILCKEGYPINAVIIGDGSERQKLEEEARLSGMINHVKFVEETFDENIIGPWLHAADVCISPGEVGLTAIHALAYGTPVITHDDFDYQMPEVGAIQQNITGAFFKRGSAEELVIATRNWLSHVKDRETVRLNCQDIIERFYNPQMQEQLTSSAILKILNNA